NEVMFGPPGFAYIYFTYGMHWMLNVTAQDHGVGAAVLIRAAEPLSGIEEMKTSRPKAVKNEDLLNGPAKICAAYQIDRNLNGIDLLDPSSELRIEPGNNPKHILFGIRIGLAKGKGESHDWRFVDGDRLPWVSTPKANLRPLLAAPESIAPPQ